MRAPFQRRTMDKKPNVKANAPPAFRARAELIVAKKRQAVISSQEAGQSSSIAWDRSRRGNKTGLVFMRQQGGRFGRSPAMDVAYWLRAKLRGGPGFAPITVYDASGKPIATVDPTTRVRTPIAPAGGAT
jgi:hypothetical protein